MPSSNHARINSFLEDLQSLSPEKLAIVESIRALFHQASNELEEEIKYGGLVFNSRNKLIGGIFPYTKHISIEFSNGAQFDDPAGLLEGKGKMRRHLKIVEQQDIQANKADAFIAQAVKLS